ncbi:glucan endo-1,3-beta-glucosidase 8-like [Durio zibethinus]|uniref:glucan endo-1,3-beta-D-glucosidase n=1 Tax=Durio zibethinus TaxID=66656 RepID=A0A6P5YKX2_DURZI|nr:glucan endo-1,3-beta-glucosidase 8-like [Durio zibethinus]
MARAMALLWASALILVPAIVVAQDIGVNWGTIASHPLDPKIVVNMFKDNGIKKVKLFDAASNTLKALAGTDIEVMVGIPNLHLQNLAENYSYAQAWVKENITAHVGKEGVNIKYVAVGNEPFLASYNGTYTNSTFPAMKNILKALNEAGVGKDIKVSTPLNGDVYMTPTYKPSDGIFRGDIADIMGQICEFLQENDAPFVINIYPFFNLYQNPGFPKEYAFFDNNSSDFDDDGVKYHNVFDANIDTLVAALQKAKTPDLPIIVGEVGWPTDGNIYATKQNAKRFYDGLLKKMASNDGTPLRPKKNPDVYMFCWLDEDLKSIDPGLFERHWGIFSFDGQPKFPMDLSGEGQNKSLVGAKDVPYFEKQWCVHNKDAPNQEDLAVKIEWACNNTDCTTLVPGASCSDMGLDMNASVAFNMYYQMQNQAEAACDFQGLAKLVKQDPSNETCQFPIMIKQFESTSSAPEPSGSSSDSPGSDSSTHSLSPSLQHLLQIVVGICIFWFA